MRMVAMVDHMASILAQLLIILSVAVLGLGLILAGFNRYDSSPAEGITLVCIGFAGIIYYTYDVISPNRGLVQQ